MGVSKNRGTLKSSILIGFSLINHPFWGTPIFGNTHISYRVRKRTPSPVSNRDLFHSFKLFTWKFRYSSQPKGQTTFSSVIHGFSKTCRAPSWISVSHMFHTCHWTPLRKGHTRQTLPKGEMTQASQMTLASVALPGTCRRLLLFFSCTGSLKSFRLKRLKWLKFLGFSNYVECNIDMSMPKKHNHECPTYICTSVCIPNMILKAYLVTYG